MPNLGDALAPVILKHFLRLDPVWVTRRFKGKILSTGSVLGACRPGDLVIGSGLIEPRTVDLPDSVRVVALRGPLSAKYLSRRLGGVAYGDPALLLPLLGLGDVTRTGRIGLVSHYVDQRLSGSLKAEDVLHIDVQQPWRGAVSAIRSCSAVISSSLHGLVVAEAFGIPAIHVQFSDNVKGGRFKFDDYYLGTQRLPNPPLTLGEALDLARSGDQPNPVLDLTSLASAFQNLAAELRDGSQ